MSKAQIMAELPNLPPADLREILNRILELHDPMDNDAFTNEERALIEKRLADHDADPASAVPWDVVKGRLIERYGE
jgi:putative addiction module component (TIGR02574 family)